jgi:hypothetical protein
MAATGFRKANALLGLAVGFALTAAVPHGAAEAGDYMHVCRTADGSYEINDGELSATEGDARRPIPYRTVSETVMTERRGYCQAKGHRYEFHGKTYVLKIRFQDRGSDIETDALCELAADGLPAAYRCEREVVTYEKTASVPKGPASADGTTIWDHNGSLMRLEFDGAVRRFTYDRPRPGMVAAGARPGDVVFEGRREGEGYVGTAFIFSQACGRVPYAVRGRVSADNRRVTLAGNAPRIGRDCRVESTRRDVLVFDLAVQR